MKKVIRKWAKKTFTIILIPHNISRPIRITLSWITFLLLFIIWLSSITVSFIIISRRINYQLVIKANEYLKEKTEFFANALTQSRELIDKVKDIDIRLRSLLAMKTKKEIIEIGGAGGPSLLDQTRLDIILHEGEKIPKEEFTMNLEQLKKGIWERRQSLRQIDAFLANQKALLAATPMGWPTYGRITSRFGWRRNPFSGRNEFHKAIDIGNLKATPIRATADGKVTFAGWAGGYGKIVIINHGFGFSTIYAHCYKLLVKVNEKVKRGDIIALMGNSGMATAPHLHYEVRYKGKALNPMRFVRR